MPIDPISNDNDRILVNRLHNLEERVKDLMTAHQRFVSLMEVQELLTLLSTDVAVVKELLSSVEKRLTILEDIPDPSDDFS